MRTRRIGRWGGWRGLGPWGRLQRDRGMPDPGEKQLVSCCRFRRPGDGMWTPPRSTTSIAPLGRHPRDRAFWGRQSTWRVLLALRRI